MTKRQGNIYAGIGGWTYEPWRGVFYPKGLPHARELAYAGAHLTSIEINGTFYRTQSPATFRKWASEVPHKFVFSLKGPRYAVNRRVLSEAGDSIKRFLDSGVTELGPRLGPLLWQFTPYKKFDEADFGGFLELLQKTFDGRALRHVVEVRHDSFKTEAFVALLRNFELPVVFAEHDTYPAIADVTADFVYARLQKGDEKLKAGYPPKAVDGSATRRQSPPLFSTSSRARRSNCSSIPVRLLPRADRVFRSANSPLRSTKSASVTSICKNSARRRKDALRRAAATPVRYGVSTTSTSGRLLRGPNSM